MITGIFEQSYLFLHEERDYGQLPFPTQWIRSGFQENDETAANKFLLNKTCSIDIVCTYYIVCTCSNCGLFKSIS